MFRGFLLNLGFGAIALAAQANPPGWKLVRNDGYNQSFHLILSTQNGGDWVSAGVLKE